MGTFHCYSKAEQPTLPLVSHANHYYYTTRKIMYMQAPRVSPDRASNARGSSLLFFIIAGKSQHLPPSFFDNVYYCCVHFFCLATNDTPVLLTVSQRQTHYSRKNKPPLLFFPGATPLRPSSTRDLQIHQRCRRHKSETVHQFRETRHCHGT